MKKLFLAFLLATSLGACTETTPEPANPITEACVPTPGLPPCSSHMDVGNRVAAPWQAKEFCATHPEFEKCKASK